MIGRRYPSLPTTAPYTPAPADTWLREMGRIERPAERGPFRRWLVRQEERGLGAGLNRSAKVDPQLRLDGDPEAVRARLRECMAEGNMPKRSMRGRAGMAELLKQPFACSAVRRQPPFIFVH